MTQALKLYPEYKDSGVPWLREIPAHLPRYIRITDIDRNGNIRKYHTRLITDVVTGKLDVNGVPLPDLDANDEPDDLELKTQVPWPPIQPPT